MNPTGQGDSATLARVTQAALVVAAVCFIYEQAIIAQSIIPPLIVFLVGDLIIAGAIARGWRWGPLAGAIWMGLTVLVSISAILGDLANPSELHEFLWQVVTTITSLIGIAAGIGAVLVGRRGLADGRS